MVAHPFQNFPGKGFLDFCVPWHRLDDTANRIDPQGMAASLTFQEASRLAKPAFEVAAFHETKSFSQMTSLGRPRV
jgi:hypothetical protein